MELGLDFEGARCLRERDGEDVLVGDLSTREFRRSSKDAEDQVHPRKKRDVIVAPSTVVTPSMVVGAAS
jgi:hypothetical protein